MNKVEFIYAFMEEVWNQQRCEKIGRYISPDYTIHRDAGDPWEGKTLSHASFKERLLLSFTPFPDIHFEILSAIEEESCVAISWEMTGTNLGTIMEMPATGKKICTKGMTIYHFDNGLISGHTQVFDRQTVMRQLGFGKA